MSYDPRLLFAQICVHLDQTPARSLIDLSREFQVGARTIQGVVAEMTGGGKFTSFRDDILIARLTRLFLAQPNSPIKEISFELGYKSSRTFARAVRRAFGASPAELRKQIATDIAGQHAHRPRSAAAKTH